jgi:hypothetical protein
LYILFTKRWGRGRHGDEESTVTSVDENAVLGFDQMAGTPMIFIVLPFAFLFGVLLRNAFTHPWRTRATFTRWSCWYIGFFNTGILTLGQSVSATNAAFLAAGLIACISIVGTVFVRRMQHTSADPVPTGTTETTELAETVVG